MKHNIVRMPIITKYITKKNVLKSKLQFKYKYTRPNNTPITSFQRLNKQTPVFSKFYPIYILQRKHSKPLTGHAYDFSIKPRPSK